MDPPSWDPGTAYVFDLITDEKLLAWESCLTVLRQETDPSARADAAERLTVCVERLARELSTESFEKFELQLHQRVVDMLAEPELAKKLGAVAAIYALVGTASMQAEATKKKFSLHLSYTLETSKNYELLNEVAKALGYMARTSISSSSEYVENEISQALQWLKEENWHRKLAACLVLRELAQKAPSWVYGSMHDIIPHIVKAVHGDIEKLRETAAEALTMCLAMSARRRNMLNLNWRYIVFQQLREGFSKPTEANVHGSILMAGPMLEHGGNFMMPRFDEICAAVMGLKDNHSRCVKLSVITLLPQLALYSPLDFSRKYLIDTLKYLYASCQSRCDQSASAYKALGKLTLALGVADLRKEVVALVDVVLIGLEAEQGPAPKPPRRGTRDSDRDRDKEKGKGKVSCCPAAMECLANITQALGELLAPFMPKLLGPLFSNGLSERMIATLKVLSETLPSHTTQVQERLLHEISMILCGQPHNPPGSVP
ncbi:unnamed protein product, partial [Ectocarpus sp. 12 AP-2014]